MDAPASVAICKVCGKGPALSCARCKSSRYCGVTCQRADWPSHKLSCVAKKLGVSLQDYVKEGLNMGVLKYDDEVEQEMPQDLNTTDVNGILNDRAKDYGKFIEGAEIMQMLKRIVHTYIEMRDTQLAFDQREALDMIMHKVGRILNGNPDKIDNWVDIAGYATLVADRLDGNAR